MDVIGSSPVAGEVIEHLPLFPLPNAVLFPNTLLPLHIFEPRYRQLLRRVVAGDGRLAMALLAPGWEPHYYGAPAVFPVLGLAQLVEHQTMDDGRSNLLVRGVARLQLLDEHQTELEFRTVRACVLDTGRGAAGELAGTIATVRQLFATVAGRIPDLRVGDMAGLYGADALPGQVLDSIAAAVPAPPARKQEVLTASSLSLRADLVMALLVDIVAGTLGRASAES